MMAATPKVITIPANPELVRSKAVQRQLRVAAYCRVSTDSEEQLTSYEAQKNYYTDKIMTNPSWTMAGIFADEGITGTSATKRPEFLRMIRKCRQKKIDLVLVKSISRFARNTVDCLNYMRALRELGIAIIFEEQNINTLENDSELLITMLGAVAQGESESISENVKWGIRQAMREGKAAIQYKRLYAYEKGEDGKPRIIPEQAEVVRRIYDSFLAGQSLRMIKDMLERKASPPSAAVRSGPLRWSGASSKTKNTVGMFSSRRPSSTTASAASTSATWDSSPCIWCPTTMRASSAGTPSTRYGLSSPAAVLDELPARKQHPLAAPATAPSTPSPSGWCAASAAPSTADAYGANGDRKRLCGAVPAGWTMPQNTAMTPPLWMKSPFKPPSSPLSTRP